MKYFTLILAATFLAACEKATYTSQGPTAGDASSALQARFEAAKGIVSLESREEALGKLATDAAEAKDLKVVLRAIDNIVRVDLRDKTSEACALLLAKKGEVKAATEVAGKIIVLEIRDRTLNAIAKGQ